ncbi:hypothetical protein VTI74DRAFT_5372 [Chaetomium olivicolor]
MTFNQPVRRKGLGPPYSCIGKRSWTIRAALSLDYNICTFFFSFCLFHSTLVAYDMGSGKGDMLGNRLARRLASTRGPFCMVGGRPKSPFFHLRRSQKGFTFGISRSWCCHRFREADLKSKEVFTISDHRAIAPFRESRLCRSLLSFCLPAKLETVQYRTGQHMSAYQILTSGKLQPRDLKTFQPTAWSPLTPNDLVTPGTGRRRQRDEPRQPVSVLKVEGQDIDDSSVFERDDVATQAYTA